MSCAKPPFLAPAFSARTALGLSAPKLIAEIEFAEWTHDGHLRAPSYKGLREDKSPEDVRREEAITDVLRLSRGMTYKAAAAGLNLGGGKAVIIGDAKKEKTEALLRAFGRYVESLNGLYITAEDVGTSTRMRTAHQTILHDEEHRSVLALPVVPIPIP